MGGAEGETGAELVDALVQASFTVIAALTRVGAVHDLSLTQLRVLGIVRDRHVQMSALADYLGLERSTVSGLIDRAASRGLVRRVRGGDDRRSVEVTLSAAGRELADVVYAELTAILDPALTGLGPAGEVALADQLRRTLAPREVRL